MEAAGATGPLAVASGPDPSDAVGLHAAAEPSATAAARGGSPASDDTAIRDAARMSDADAPAAEPGDSNGLRGAAVLSAAAAAYGESAAADDTAIRVAARLGDGVPVVGVTAPVADVGVPGACGAAAEQAQFAASEHERLAAAAMARLRPLAQAMKLRPAPPSVGGTQLNVRGVRVSFPFAAYRSQLAMMHSVITVAKNRTHALVESPTGTGKSMALLCSALAWQRNETVEAEREFTEAIRDRSARGVAEPGTASVVATRETLPVMQVPVLDDRAVAGLSGEARGLYATEVGRLAVAAAIAESEVDGGLSQFEMCEVGCKVLRSILDTAYGVPKAEESMERIRAAKELREGKVTAVKCAPVLAESARMNVERSDLATPRHQLAGKRGAQAVGENDDDDDFVEPKKLRDTSWQNAARPGRGRGGAANAVVEEKPENAHLSTQAQLAALDAFQAGGPGAGGLDGQVDDATQEQGKVHRRKPGRIFYCSRTHSQLKQVVKELKYSGYKPRMTILASRNEYCLNPIAKKSDNTTESCDKLLHDNACFHYQNRDAVAAAMRARIEPFDIEEMNEVGRESRGCSYFAAVDMMKDAELILCPYNYLLDANIRQSRMIEVKGDIVIFDEAHNIEDHAREAASFTEDRSSFRSAVAEIQELTTMGRISRPGGDLAQAYLSVQELFSAVDKLCDLISSSGRFRQESNSELAAYDRAGMVDCLDEVNLTLTSVQIYRRSANFIMASRDEDYEYVAGTAYGGEDMDAGSTISFGKGAKGRNIRNGGGSSRSRRNQKAQKPKCKCVSLASRLCTPLLYALEDPDSFVLALQRVSNQWESKTELNLWCLNAAVPFKELSEKARSIIVTSGTLTPLDSFAGELNINFTVAKSLPHVVNVRKQVYTSVVASGPGLVRMDTTYRNASNFKFQDSLGAAIVEYCKVIPGGVLIFFPSYRLLNLLVQRWKSSGCWEELELTKGLVVCESSRRGREFKDDMLAYNRAAHTPEGAIMLGVCRGKISEGLDFKDDAARGVLIIGIPYPAFTCPQLTRKRAWNDHERKENDRDELLSGSAWYEMQAFRALNQAVGRCVRHREDYGAIVLLDQRFRSTTVTKQLPGWVQGAMRPNAPATHEATIQGLTTFFASLETQ